MTNDPTISLLGPTEIPRASSSPSFIVNLASAEYYVVEVATQPELFNWEDYGDQRNPDEFYPDWENESVDLQTEEMYTIPEPVWNRLKHADELYYRMHSATALPTLDEWPGYHCTVNDEDAASAPSFQITDADDPGTSVFELNGSVGAGGVNEPTDVLMVKRRLAELGFNWLSLDTGVDNETIRTIKLFQSIIKGKQTVSGDGRIDVPGPSNGTYSWLRASNAPRWQLMPVGAKNSSHGFYNTEVAEELIDSHDYGTDWLADTISSAGRAYYTEYLMNAPHAAPITINNASLPRGGDTRVHKGHETGMSFDLRLPRTDGRVGGITHTSRTYDRSAMRAMLNALWDQPLVTRIFFNDEDLIRDALCQEIENHDDHAHVEIKQPV